MFSGHQAFFLSLCAGSRIFTQHRAVCSRGLTSMSFVRRIEAGPLTTTFTPPPACATPYLSSLGGTVFLAQQFKCVRGSSGADILLDYSCLPREWNRPNGAGQQTLLVHSPGLVCPAGFTSACTISRDSAVPAVTGEYSASLLIYNALRTGEVAVGCCPR